MANESQLQVILKKHNVAQENAQSLIKAFGAPFEEAGEILSSYETIKVTEEDQFDLMAEARDKRLTLKNIRVSVEKRRKELKEDSLRTGRAIDSVAKFIKETIEPAEEYLEQQEKFAEIKKQERLAKIKAERVEKLMKYTDDLSLYNLDDLSDEQFDSLLNQLKSQHEAELEKEREAERKRQAKLEAERQKEIAAEREKAEAERKQREALEAESRAKEEEEARLKAEAEEAQRNALLAPDKDKLLAFAQSIDAIEPPHVSNREAGKVLDETMDFLERISKNLRTKAKEL